MGFLYHVAATALIVAGSLADYLSTRYGLAHGLHELNPVVSFVGLTPIKIVSAFVMSWMTWTMPAKHALTSAWIVFAIYCAVAVYNVAAVYVKG